MTASDLILSVRDLRTEFPLARGTLRAVDSVSFDLARGEVIGLVGESGCGKSITARSILRLVRKPGKTYGKVLFSPLNEAPVELIGLPPMGKEIRKIRGRYINMVFQEPMNSLSPVHTIANQMVEAIRLHKDVTPEEARQRSIELLGLVGIPDPESRIDSYSFQLSGGMQQRALIAMAVSCDPELLIADEPTTALDVSVQAQILRLLRDLAIERGMSMIFITHDLAVIAQMAQRIMVMYLGLIVEEGSVRDIFANPRHPYTRKLLASILDPRSSRSAGSIDAISGAVPEPIDLPERCSFYERCEERDPARCRTDKGPELVDIGSGHRVRCFREHDVAMLRSEEARV